jgi:tetratricopeptide (TPR) repeat protein
MKILNKILIIFAFTGISAYSFVTVSIFATENTNTEKAYASLKQNDFEEAIKQFSYLMNNYDNYAPFYYGRGMAYYYSNKINEAETDFVKATKIDADYFEAFMGLAFALLAKGKNKNCLDILNKAININSNSSDAYYSRGLVNYIEQNYKKSIADYNLALNLNSKNINAIYGRAIAYYQLKDYQNAKIDFENYLSESDNNVLINEVLINECQRLLFVINKK